MIGNIMYFKLRKMNIKFQITVHNIQYNAIGFFLAQIFKQ